ncbi:MAG: uroporphyrinogen decarboxylase [Planctomycetes bacterium]|nr:uroporphyrinogen decarboxylase [Planctomycetota bacterium]
MSTPPVPLIVRALRGEATERRPVWLMRQAGRYLPGYQKVRSQISFLELCRRPDLSAEVSLEPVERFGVDAAIVFSDILVPLQAMGIEVDFPDKGPQIMNPVRDAAGVAKLKPFDPATGTPWILETLSTLAKVLPAGVPPLGFCGAPWTLAVYAVEGKMSKDLVQAKTMRWKDPDTLKALIRLLAESTVPYLAAQARAGAQGLQVFDTWAGALSRDDWEEFALPGLRIVFDGVHKALGPACPPLVLYSQGTAAWRDLLPRSGADAYSVDWRVPLGEWKRAVGGAPVQGNLDPTALFGTPDSVRAATRAMLASVAGQPGVVANLGHGVIVGTPVENVAAFVDAVKA